MKVSVIGTGAWGTALALVLHENQHEVTLWAHDPHTLEKMARDSENSRLPGIPLPRAFIFQPSIEEAARNAEALVIAVPSKYFREVTSHLSAFSGLVISVTKGIEYDTGLTMSGVLAQTMPKAHTAVLSGPTLALEVARHTPSAIVVANHTEKSAQTVQTLFLRPYFRVYTCRDVIGVELGGALKNTVAIGAGVCDGLGLGDNSKAAMITRAIVEMRRLGVAGGAQPETFYGLSGLGDLIVTCSSQLSRNRSFGERIGKGESVQQILASTTSVAEGYPTARSAYQLARKLKVETPIIDEVHAMLYLNKDVGQSVLSLMERGSKAE